jgi:hypothetical protein
MCATIECSRMFHLHVPFLELYRIIYIDIYIYIYIYKAIILPVVLYGCETWPVTLKEEHRLRGFGKGVLKSILGPNREEVAGGWKRLHNEELHTLYQISLL